MSPSLWTAQALSLHTRSDGKWFYNYKQLTNGMPKDPNGKELDDEGQIKYLEELCNKYPIALSRTVSTRTTGRAGRS